MNASGQAVPHSVVLRLPIAVVIAPPSTTALKMIIGAAAPPNLVTMAIVPLKSATLMASATLIAAEITMSAHLVMLPPNLVMPIHLIMVVVIPNLVIAVPPLKAAGRLVIAVVDIVLTLVPVVQGAALHLQVGKAAVVAAVAEITAPAVIRVAAA